MSIFSFLKSAFSTKSTPTESAITRLANLVDTANTTAHPGFASRTLDFVRADITTAKVADDAAQTALDAAKLAKQKTAETYKFLVAEGRDLVTKAIAEFDALESDVSKIIGEVESKVETVVSEVEADVGAVVQETEDAAKAVTAVFGSAHLTEKPTA
jgi:hypothetical protein